MGKKPQLLDQWGNPVQRQILTQEVAAPTLGGVRSPMTGYPGDGLNPARLTSILRAADAGDPVRYMELASVVEERDLHYLGVLGTRKRAVSQLDITVKEAEGNPRSAEMVARIEKWLGRDELTDELFNLLDAVGKGYGFTEIVWDISEGQFQPKTLKDRDQRWFRFAREDLSTPLMLNEAGREERLPAFKFIFARMQAMTGLPLRSGIARVAFWNWLFKGYTQRDWAIFTQTYGQPLRIGKYGPGTSEEDRNKLFRAVANIAGDMAAIIPESMMLEFIQTPNLSAAADVFERRCDWLDRQTSKLVLGQTATTDAVTGGLGSGKEHRQVQEDIERADAKQLSAILNAQLIQPWMQLEFGPQPSYPQLVIGRPEEEDLAALSSALAPFLSHGYEPTPETLGKFGLKPRTKGSDAPPKPPETQVPGEDEDEKPPQRRFEHRLNTREENSRANPALQSESPSAGVSGRFSPEADLADRLDLVATPPMAVIMARIEGMLEAASSLEEFGEMLRASFPDLDVSTLARVMSNSAVAAYAGGRAMVDAESDD